MTSEGERYKAPYDRSSGDAVDAKTVNDIHRKSDVDSSQKAQHHSLGTKHDQATAGDHMHDGRNSRKIMAGMTITGSKGGNAALASVIAQLVKLGATDNST